MIYFIRNHQVISGVVQAYILHLHIALLLEQSRNMSKPCWPWVNQPVCWFIAIGCRNIMTPWKKAPTDGFLSGYSQPPKDGRKKAWDREEATGIANIASTVIEPCLPVLGATTRRNNHLSSPLLTIDHLLSNSYICIAHSPSIKPFITYSQSLTIDYIAVLKRFLIIISTTTVFDSSHWVPDGTPRFMWWNLC